MPLSRLPWTLAFVRKLNPVEESPLMARFLCTGRPKAASYGIGGSVECVAGRAFSGIPNLETYIRQGLL